MNITNFKKGVVNMKYSFIGKNVAVTDKLREKSEEKLGKLQKFFKDDAEVFITMGIQRNMHVFEVTIPYHGVVFRAESSTSDMYASIDKAIDILEGQIRKNKTRLERRLRDSAFDPSNFEDYDDNDDDQHNFRVIKTKKFPVKPMDVEEALLQMNMVGHEFFVFMNADSNVLNVVYKRRDGDYGLIEPEN